MIYYKSTNISDNSDAFNLKSLHHFRARNKCQPQQFSHHNDLATEKATIL